MNTVVIPMDNGDGNEEHFEPDSAEDGPAPKQRRLRGKQFVAVHPSTPRPLTTPQFAAVPPLTPQPAALPPSTPQPPAPPSWQQMLHTDDLQLMQAVDDDENGSGVEDDKEERERNSSSSSQSDDGVVNARPMPSVRPAMKGEPWKKFLIGQGEHCVGVIVVNELHGGLSLGAHCNCAEHARPCRLNRTCRHHKRAGPGMDWSVLSAEDQAQGRPLGLLVSWLMHSHTFCSKRGDKKKARKRHKSASSAAESIVARLASRRAARRWLSELAQEDEQLGYLLHLERSIRSGEMREPIGLCGGG